MSKIRVILDIDLDDFIEASNNEGCEYSVHNISSYEVTESLEAFLSNYFDSEVQDVEFIGDN